MSVIRGYPEIDDRKYRHLALIWHCDNADAPLLDQTSDARMRRHENLGATV